MNHSMIDYPIDKVGIIGAGVAGLFAARTLQKAGFTFEIFERNSGVGGVWNVGYHTYGLQTPRELYDFPDWPMPDDFPLLPTGEQLQSHIASYARQFGLMDHIHFHCDVTKFEPNKDGAGWIVHYTNTKTGEQAQKVFDFLVVANGLYANPNIPSVADRDVFDGEVLHSSEYQSPAQAKNRRVVVVGYGKSSLDVAVDASKHARDVTLLFREVHWPVPVHILGLLDSRKIFSTRLASGFLPLYQRPLPWQQALHDKAPWLVWGFWRVVEAILRYQFRLDQSKLVPSTPVEHDLFSGGILPTPETFPRLAADTIHPRKGSIARFLPNGVELADGGHIEADMVIFATGWRRDFAMFPESFHRHIDSDGVYLYRHILHPDLRNLAFIGWASTFSNSLTSHFASIWLSKLLKGEIDLPDHAAMMREIEDTKTWKRGFMPDSSSRAALLQLHMWHFHDDLLRDMGIDPKRKPSAFAELFDDYKPADYADLIRE